MPNDERKIKSFKPIERLVKAIIPEQKNVQESSSIPKEENEILINEFEELQSLNEHVKINEEANSVIAPELQKLVENPNAYKIYKDKDDVFEAQVSIEGSTLNSISARLILEAEPWNIVLKGRVYNDGRCVVPLKKMAIYPENTTGKISLELIIDGTLFVLWEETFVVEIYKKVTVEVKSQQKDDDK